MVRTVKVADRRNRPLIVAALDRVSRNAEVFQKMIDQFGIRIICGAEGGLLDRAAMLAKTRGGGPATGVVGILLGSFQTSQAGRQTMPCLLILVMQLIVPRF